MPVNFNIQSGSPAGNPLDNDSISAMLFLTTYVGANVWRSYKATSAADAIAWLGIDDVDLELKANQYIEDYYALAGDGAILFLGIMTDYALPLAIDIDVETAARVMQLSQDATTQGFTLRQMAVVIHGDMLGAYNTTPGIGCGFRDDLGLVVSALLTQNNNGALRKKPIVYLLEGDCFGTSLGDLGAVIDPALLLGGQAPSGAGVCISLIDTKFQPAAPNYRFHIGAALGNMAKLPCYYNIGGHQQGNIIGILAVQSQPVWAATAYPVATDESKWELLSQTGLLFATKEKESEMFFFDDKGVGSIPSLAHCKTTFKAKRLLYDAYSAWQNEPLALKGDGTMRGTTLAQYRGIGNDVLTTVAADKPSSMLGRGEISSAKIIIDPAQKPSINNNHVLIDFELQLLGFAHTISGTIFIKQAIQ